MSTLVAKQPQMAVNNKVREWCQEAWRSFGCIKINHNNDVKLDKVADKVNDVTRLRLQQDTDSVLKILEGPESLGGPKFPSYQQANSRFSPKRKTRAEPPAHLYNLYAISVHAYKT